MTTAKIKLDKQELSAEEFSWMQDNSVGTNFAYPLNVTITSNVNLEEGDTAITSSNEEDYNYPANILVLQLSGTQFDPNQGDMFIRVADVTDLYELPTADTIDEMNKRSNVLSTPYYRTNTFKLFCRSVEEANAVWKILKQEARSFINSYNTAHNPNISKSESVIL